MNDIKDLEIKKIDWGWLVSDAVVMKKIAIEENDTEALEWFKEIELELEEIIELGERLLRK
jgi:hypothetical protein